MVLQNYLFIINFMNLYVYANIEFWQTLVCYPVFFCILIEMISKIFKKVFKKMSSIPLKILSFFMCLK